MAQLVRDAVRTALAEALGAAQESGALPRLPGAEITVERPQKPEHGDYASSVALRLAGTLKRKPLEVAQAIAESIETGASSRPSRSPRRGSSTCGYRRRGS